MKKKQLIFLLLIFVVGILIYSLYQNSYYFIAPDEAVNKQYSEIFSETGNLYYPLDNNSFNYLTRLRGTYVLNEKIVPLKFLGFPFLLGNIHRIIPEVLFLIIPIFAVLTIFILFKISYLLGRDKKTAFSAMLILLFLPFFWYWANHSFFENILAIFFFIFGFYYFLKIFNGSKIGIQHYVLLSLLWGISFLIRYDMALLMISFSIPFVFSIKKLKFKWLFLSILTFLLVVFSTLLIYNLTYGEFFLYGSKILGGIYGNPLKTLTNVILNYKRIFLFFPMISLILIPFLRKNSYLFSKVKYGLIIYFLIFSYFFLSEFSLMHPNALHESFTRYALGFYILASFLLASFATNLRNKKLTIFFIVIILIFSISSTYPLVSFQWKTMENNQEIEQNILKYVNSDDFLIVSGEDKFLQKIKHVIPINLFRNAITGESDYDVVFSKLNLINEKNEVYIYCDTLDYDEILYYLEKYSIDYSRINTEEISCLLKLKNETTN